MIKRQRSLARLAAGTIATTTAGSREALLAVFDVLAAQLALLVDGASVNAQVNPAAPAARQAKKAAAVLIARALAD